MEDLKEEVSSPLLPLTLKLVISNPLIRPKRKLEDFLSTSYQKAPQEELELIQDSKRQSAAAETVKDKADHANTSKSVDYQKKDLV